MKFVDSLPPLVEVPNMTGVREPHRTQAVRPLHEHLFPPHIVEHYPQREVAVGQAPDEAVKEEKRANKERRRLCRRIESAERLLETRSNIERRRKCRRRSDAATAVDEEV